MKTENKIILAFFFVMLTMMTTGMLATFLVSIDFFKNPLVYNDEACVRVASFGSSEDQTKFNNNSILMTEWDTLKYKPGEDRPGAMYVASGFQQSDELAKNTNEFVEKHLAIEKLPLVGFPEGIDFHPHGIYVHKPDNTLYVVNHAYENGGERIEVFDIVTDGDVSDDNSIPTKLNHKYSITSDWMKKELNGVLNSLVVVEPNKFYVTQYEARAQDRSRSDFQLELEFLKTLWLQPKKTCVWFCEYGSTLECKKVADKFVMANGITHNADFSNIFVADFTGRTISVFDRDASTNDLSNRVRVIFPHANVDNLKFDESTGKVYGGGLTNLYQSFKNFALYHGKETEESTSGLIELSYFPKLDKKKKPTKGWAARSVLSTSKLNMATNGIKMNSHFVMGSGVGFNGLLICPLVEDGKKQFASSGARSNPFTPKQTSEL